MFGVSDTPKAEIYPKFLFIFVPVSILLNIKTISYFASLYSWLYMLQHQQSHVQVLVRMFSLRSNYGATFVLAISGPGHHERPDSDAEIRYAGGDGLAPQCSCDCGYPLRHV